MGNKMDMGTKKAIARFNSVPHRYIYKIVTTQEGMCVCGSIGERLFIGYSLGDAIKKYNKMARAEAKGHPTSPYTNIKERTDGAMYLWAEDAWEACKDGNSLLAALMLPMRPVKSPLHGQRHVMVKRARYGRSKAICK